MLAKYRPSDMMGAMNWPDILEALRKRGWTQALLADRLGIVQSAVSDLRSGKTKDPKHSTGEAIRALLESEEAPAAAQQPPAEAAA